MESQPLLSSTSSSSTAKQSLPFRLYAAAICACLTPLSYGVCLGYTSPAFPDMLKNKFITENENSWFSALLPLAAMAGAMAAGKGIESCGRQTILIVTGLPFIGGWILVASSSLAASYGLHSLKIFLLYLGRILTGFATGSGTICSPTYLAEIAPAEKRGMIGSLNQLFATLGIELVYVLGYLIPSWEWLAILSVVPPACGTILMLFCPESPRWLVSQNRDSDALEALAEIRPLGWDNMKEVQEARQAMTLMESQSKSSFWQMIKKRSIYVPLIIALGLMIFQQFSGINAIMFNAETIFAQSGFHDSALAMIILGGVNVVATVLSVAVIDKWGRRILLNVGAVGMFVALVVSGFADYLALDLSSVSLVALLGFIVFFAIGFGPIPWLMTSEVFPNHCRGVASAIASNANWISCFLVTKTFQDLQSSIHSYGAYWFYACWCLVAFVFTLTLVPETKGVSLESIERNFEHGRLCQVTKPSAARPRMDADEVATDYEPIA